MIAKELTESLRNIGPKMAQKLITAGIDTPEKLRKLGAEEAYIQILKTGGFCGIFHAAYLYALWGAIYNCDWRNIPEQKKEEFRAFTKDLRNS